LIIKGSGGKIEMRISKAPLKVAKSNPLVILFHQHPDNNGNMDDPVIKRAFKAFCMENFNVVSINFRGCGLSQGQISNNGDSAVEDAANCMDWLRMHYYENNEFWVCGYSFGAWVALQALMRRPDCSRFVALSLPTNLYDFSFLSPCPTSGLVISGTHDSLVSVESSTKFKRQIMKQRSVKVEFSQIEKANHWFKSIDDNKDQEEKFLQDLEDSIKDYIERTYYNINKKPSGISPSQRDLIGA
jgi:alpha/beta superfamily hydrolase